MSLLSAFLSGSAALPDAVDFLVSPRFLDEMGEPVSWRLRPIDAETDRVLREKSMRRIVTPEGLTLPELDVTRYQQHLVAACVLVPDLMGAELQNSWGVVSPEALLGRMLLPGEYARLLDRVLELCGLADSPEAAVDAAKK